MERDDGELIRAFQQGDRGAFDELYLRYRDWVNSLAYRFTGNREDTLDVLQETFAYFFRKLPEFELRAQLRTFLYPVVKHLAIKRRRPPAVPLAEPAIDPPSEHAEDLLAGLPEDQREIVWLRIVDGLDLAQIAGILQIPLGTVKSRLHAALSYLRKNR